MTSQQQRDALHRQIWAIANEVRGAVDGWDFKQFVLGALFYRFDGGWMARASTVCTLTSGRLGECLCVELSLQRPCSPAASSGRGTLLSPSHAHRDLQC
jgi:hypothetical protein